MVWLEPDFKSSESIGFRYYRFWLRLSTLFWVVTLKCIESIENDQHWPYSLNSFENPIINPNVRNCWCQVLEICNTQIILVILVFNREYKKSRSRIQKWRIAPLWSIEFEYEQKWTIATEIFHFCCSFSVEIGKTYYNDFLLMQTHNL